MADFIKATPEMINAKATEIRNLKAEYEDVIKRIGTVVGTLDDDFAGAAKNAFQSKFEGMQPTFVAFGEALESLSVALNTAATGLSEADAAAAARISGM